MTGLEWLTEDCVRSLSFFLSAQASDIEALKGRGAKLIDVRPPTEFVYGYLEGSVNVPLYRLIDGWSKQQILRKAGYSFFGIANGTEKNPDFEQDMLRAVTDKNDEIIGEPT